MKSEVSTATFPRPFALSLARLRGRAARVLALPFRPRGAPRTRAPASHVPVHTPHATSTFPATMQSAIREIHAAGVRWAEKFIIEEVAFGIHKLKVRFGGLGGDGDAPVMLADGVLSCRPSEWRDQSAKGLPASRTHGGARALNNGAVQRVPRRWAASSRTAPSPPTTLWRRSPRSTFPAGTRRSRASASRPSTRSTREASRPHSNCSIHAACTRSASRTHTLRTTRYIASAIDRFK